MAMPLADYVKVVKLGRFDAALAERHRPSLEDLLWSRRSQDARFSASEEPLTK